MGKEAKIESGATATVRLPLTPTQKRVLDYLRLSIRKNGYAPTAQEIADHFGWSSRNSAVSQLRALSAKGYVVLFRSRARGIAIVSRRGGWFHMKQDSENTAAA